MIVGFCLGAFYFLLAVIIRLKFPFQCLLKVMSVWECGLSHGLVSCALLSWESLALCKLHRLISGHLSVHLEVLGFSYLFGFSLG